MDQITNLQTNIVVVVIFLVGTFVVIVVIVRVVIVVWDTLGIVDAAVITTIRRTLTSDTMATELALWAT